MNNWWARRDHCSQREGVPAGKAIPGLPPIPPECLALSSGCHVLAVAPTPPPPWREPGVELAQACPIFQWEHQGFERLHLGPRITLLLGTRADFASGSCFSFFPPSSVFPWMKVNKQTEAYRGLRGLSLPLPLKIFKLFSPHFNKIILTLISIIFSKCYKATCELFSAH